MKKMYLYIAIIIILIPTNIYASNNNETSNNIDTETILDEQQSTFGIKDFLKEAENYAPDFIKELDISNIFNMALKGNIDNSKILNKILKILGSQLTDTLKILINILLIVLIHSILKSITEGLENSEISKMV